MDTVGSGRDSASGVVVGSWCLENHQIVGAGVNLVGWTQNELE